ncbi:MAG: SulP family inorganic anion transporter, partial [Desulfobacterales bacterium]
MTRTEAKHNTSALQRIFPFLLWFEDYQVTYLRSDVLAGLIAMVITTAAAMLFQLHQKGVAIVGQSPSGLPQFQLPGFDFQTVSALFGPARGGQDAR